MRFPIIPATRFWFTISIALTVASLFFLFAPSFGLRTGIDFSGGTKLYLAFENSISKEEFAGVFEETLGAEKGAIIVPSDENALMVRSKTLTSDEIETLKDSLAEKGKILKEDEIRVETVGPTQGKVQTRNGIIAVLITMAAIVIFIAIAFRRLPEGLSSWKFGLATIVALAHDVLITAGFFALLGKFYGVEVDTLFITALLTVMGFSVHDTIVVFDRLRETLKGESIKNLPELAEKAVWDTMARSVNTSLSTVIVLAAILSAKIEGIHFFVMALAVGIIVGTFSSIFVATPLVVMWSRKK